MPERAAMRQEHGLVLVLTNLPPEHTARVARALIQERLVACVNALPIQSIYPWQGEVVEEPETTLLLKTTQPTLTALLARLTELHPYSVPEILTFSPQQALALYADWAHQVLSSEAPSPQEPE